MDRDLLSQNITEQATQDPPDQSLIASRQASNDETRGGHGNVQIIGTGEDVSRETEELSTLRKRLAAGAFVILVGFGIYLIRSYFESRPLQGFHTLVVFSLGACIGLLVSTAELTLKQLRYVELVIFGLPVLFFTPYHYLCVMQQNEMGDAVGVVAIYKNVASYWFCLLVIYGLFVPNRWKRALIAVTPMVVLPVLVGVVAALRHESIGEHLDFSEITDTMMILCVGALCAAYGAEIIQSLRKEARVARAFGQYRLVRLLGKGGMGEVYEAEHRLLKRPCAIKLINPERAADRHAITRFEREVKATAKLTHWNTVDIYDYGKTDDGVFYYAMEYLPGLTVREVLAAAGPIPSSRTVHVMLQICDALIEAHERRLVHRDINSRNIFLSQRGGQYDVGKLLDFGLVKRVDSEETQITRLGSVSGTPTFMSPEQAAGDEATMASDIYSFGAVMYTMLTGRPPFMGKSAMEVMVSHIHDKAVELGEISGDIPQDLQDLVHRCLEKSPSSRFPTARNLRAALQECQKDMSWTQENAFQWWREFAPDKVDLSDG